MKILIIFLLLGSICQAQLWNRENEIAYKFHKDSTGFYLIKYEYNPDSYSVPLTYPAGEPHYFALITVYRVVENDTIQIGQSFDGTYVEKGCFEDVSEDQVKEAKRTIGMPVKERRIDSLSFSWDYVFVADTVLPEQPEITFITLESLIEYQEECYNDSTFVFDKPIRYQKCIPHHYEHRKPTFEGFIEYMKRKTR